MKKYKMLYEFADRRLHMLELDAKRNNDIISVKIIRQCKAALWY